MSTSTEPNYWHPETSDIKDAYLYANGVKSTDTPDRIADVGAEFDLWLAEHDRQMRAEALREASEAVNTKAGFLELLSRSDGPIWREQFAAWLRKRARMETTTLPPPDPRMAATVDDSPAAPLN
jgi:hypothetical protein